MHEWSLYIFTLTMQAAIGGMLMLTIYNFMLKKSNELAFGAQKIALIVFTALSVIGLAASFTHLGTPGNALNAINNLGGSWMSREILLTAVFIAVMVVTLILTLVKKKAFPLLYLLATVVGLLDVLSMASIYYVTIFPEWGNLATIASFYGTTLILGAVISYLLVAASAKENQNALLLPTAVVIILGVVVQAIFMATFGYVGLLGSGIGLLKWGLMGVGVLLTAYLGFKQNPTLIYVAFAVLIAAELISRYMFYIIPA